MAKRLQGEPDEDHESLAPLGEECAEKKLGLEPEIKEVRRTAATSPTLEEKLAHQKRQRELEAKRTKL